MFVFVDQQQNAKIDLQARLCFTSSSWWKKKKKEKKVNVQVIKLHIYPSDYIVNFYSSIHTKLVW